MNRAVAGIFAVALFITAAAQEPSASRKIDRGIEDRLRLVLSKIAPLEWWDFSWSGYGPRICAKFFRVDPPTYTKLLEAVENFQGHEKWGYPGDCLEPVTGMTFLPPLKPRSLPVPDALSMLVPPTPLSNSRREGMIEDMQRLADHIQTELHLANAQSKTFSDAMVTKAGLFRSPPAFQDFVEEGQRVVYLIVDPGIKR